MKNTVFWDVTPVVLVITDVSDERISSIIVVERISELETTLTVTTFYPDNGDDKCLRYVGSY
jgi:hypothetical protein